MLTPPPAAKQAFSLVELSIVLVILGLLIGGILTGQSLIRAAELRSVTTDIQKYRASVYSFRDKYLGLPGDLTNAVRFWGAQAGATTDGRDATCAALTTAATGTVTCNGNGDGLIADAYVDFCTYGYERYRLWQHLTNAGMVEGKYTGTQDAATMGGTYPCRSSLIGINVPRSRISNAGFMITHFVEPLTESNAVNWIIFGGELSMGGSGLELWGPIIKPEEAWNIDLKMDDGKPFSGVLRTFTASWFGYGCAASDAAGVDYNLAATSNQCMLMMKL
jgi:prepilin-type N-terminal cleavage/methylation domain-containing protein